MVIKNTARRKTYKKPLNSTDIPRAMITKETISPPAVPMMKDLMIRLEMLTFSSPSTPISSFEDLLYIRYRISTSTRNAELNKDIKIDGKAIK